MSATLAGAFVLHVLPSFLGVVAFIALALWVGILFSVSWLCGRTRWVADATEIGKLAHFLCERWATPSLVVSLVSGLLWMWATPTAVSSEPWVAGLAGAVGALLALHSSVASRAKRIASGSVRATRGEAVRRLALVVSLALLTTILGLHVGRP